MTCRGSLVVVGTGIECAGHLTTGARVQLEAADLVLYLVSDPLSEREIRRLNPSCESLQRHYGSGKYRLISYANMVSRICDEVRAGKRVCAVFYGHPGVFAMPGHAAVRMLSAEGYAARMLPAVSADACLIADLGVDPAADGWQSFEATDFLLRDRRPDPSSALVLWQVGVIGALDHHTGELNRANVQILVDRLRELYPEAHEVTLYEASTLPGFAPRIDKLPLAALPDASMSSITTMYVPPVKRAAVNAEMLERLGMQTVPSGKVCLHDEPANPESP